MEIEKIARQVIDVGQKEVFKEIDTDLRPTVDQVKNSAKVLIEYAKDLQKKYGISIADQLSTLNTENEMAILNFSRKYIREQEEYKNLMSYVFDFQNKVNEFLGQKIIMTFVAISPVSGQVTLYNMENSIKDLSIERAAESKGGHIIGRFSSLEKIKAASKIMTNEKYEESDKQTLDRTFQEVWQRYRISKDQLKLGGAAYILWYLKTWDGAWISGAGPLGEAYVAFFINNYKFSNVIERSVKDFMLNNKYGSVLADGTAGLLKGDVVKGAANFGVKIGGAQPMGYTEVIEYAQELYKATDIKEYLNNLSKKLEEKKSNNLVKPLNGIISNEIDGLTTEIEKRINEIGKKKYSNQGVLMAKITGKKT